MCAIMADIQSATAEIRRGKKERKKEETTGLNISRHLVRRAAIIRRVGSRVMQMFIMGIGKCFMMQTCQDAIDGIRG